MIKVDSFNITVEHFPDGTQKINFPEFFNYTNKRHSIYWIYDSEEEYMTLFYVVSHIKNKSPRYSSIELIMPYIPNARQDRVYGDSEVFTLKYFCTFINSMNFDKVYVNDAHSDVSLALIDNVVHDNDTTENLIKHAVMRDFREIPLDSIMVFYPDSGSVKRYSKCGFFVDYPNYIYGEKNREWRTRKITDLKVFNQDATLIRKDGMVGKSVIMVDDIICHGDTLAISASKLKSLGAEHIFACVTFVENCALDKDSKLLEALDNGTIDRVYTTDVLLTRNHDKIYKEFKFR